MRERVREREKVRETEAAKNDEAFLLFRNFLGVGTFFQSPFQRFHRKPRVKS